MDLVYYPLTNREPPPNSQRFHPVVHCRIDDCTETDAYALTRFTKSQLRQLLRVLRLNDRIPVVGNRRTRFTGEELLL